MPRTYVCNRCGHSTTHLGVMQRHCTRKRPCMALMADEAANLARIVQEAREHGALPTGATSVTNVTNVQTANTVVNITLPAGVRGFSDADLTHVTQQLLEGEVVTVRGANVPVHVERPLQDALHEACRRGWDIMEGAWDNPRKRQALGIPLCKPAIERRLSPQDVERIDDYIAEGCDAFELPYETSATRAFKRTAVDGAAGALEVDTAHPVALPIAPALALVGATPPPTTPKNSS
jgi:hypothetical protein